MRKRSKRSSNGTVELNSVLESRDEQPNEKLDENSSSRRTVLKAAGLSGVAALSSLGFIGSYSTAKWFEEGELPDFRVKTGDHKIDITKTTLYTGLTVDPRTNEPTEDGSYAGFFKNSGNVMEMMSVAFDDSENPYRDNIFGENPDEMEYFKTGGFALLDLHIKNIGENKSAIFVPKFSYSAESLVESLGAFDDRALTVDELKAEIENGNVSTELLSEFSHRYLSANLSYVDFYEQITHSEMLGKLDQERWLPEESRLARVTLSGGPENDAERIFDEIWGPHAIEVTDGSPWSNHTDEIHGEGFLVPQGEYTVTALIHISSAFAHSLFRNDMRLEVDRSNVSSRGREIKVINMYPDLEQVRLP